MTSLDELLGESPGLVAVRKKVGQLLQRQTDARRLPPILIQGETGTGKGLLARGIHRAGPRRDGPFVDVNCAAIPETLLEAEMFGFERGAFTDARQAKVGLFQAAHRGTIFLDEVGLLPDALQAKLLKVIEEQAVRRLGSTRSEPVDVWVLTATSEDLAAAARERRFREDLYHRLAVLTLWLPPLRERGQDILLLAGHFLAAACADYQLPPKQFDAAARAALLACRWPGNIRELNNVIERVALLSEGSLVTADMLGLPSAAREEPRAAPRAQEAVPLEEAVGSVEREHLLQALQQTNWNISRAAALLGISRNTLRYRIEKHGLRPGVSPGPPRREVTQRPAAEPTVPVVIPPRVPAPTSVRWERRRLTLLRAELVPPRQERPSVDASRQLEVFVEKVQSFGGRVEELGLMGMVAVFGLEPVEDAPRRAVLSARAIQKAVEHTQRGQGEPLAIRIAIHVGQFLVGQTDGATKIDLDAKRQAWAVLEGLVAAAGPNTLVVSDAAAPFLERRFDLLPAGPPEAKSYRLWGREREGLGLAGRMAKFVGRRHELGLLQSRFHSAVRGQGQVVGIAGEAGIGKSRLLYEFHQTLKGERVTYLEGRCLSYGSAIPYLPVLEILRASCGITEVDSHETITEKVRAALEAVEIDAAEVGPYLLHLLGITGSTDRLSELGPEAIKARTLETLRQMSLKGSRHNPLIIVVEDLHWIDRTSEEYFASLVETIAGTRILLVSTYRFGYRPPWIEKSYAAQIALQPLPPEDSVNVVRSALDPEQVADSLVEVLLSKAEGNPFFLEELARTVREQGGLSPTLAVPDTIEEVLLARINRLPPEEKSLLQAAAMIGKDVPFAILQAIAKLPEDALERGLIHLKAAEFLYETGLVPEIEYTFKHVLTHEVAYGSLLEERQRALHVRIVEAIEQLYPDRLADHIEQLAHHAFHGEVWGKALPYLRQAGTKAAARSAYREAVAFFEQALMALTHLNESPEVLAQAIDLRFDLRTSLLALGELGRIFDYLREAETLALTLDDQRRLGRVYAYMIGYFYLTGDQDPALDSCQRALAIATALGDFALKAETHLRLGQIYHALGNYPRAIDILRTSVESLPGDLIYERFGLSTLFSVFSRTWLIQCLAERGEFAEGVARGEEGIRIAEAVDHPYSLIQIYSGIGFLYLRKGALHNAISMLERGLGLCQTWNIPVLFPRVASSLGSAYALSGRVTEGLPLLEQAVEKSASMRFMVHQSSLTARLSEGYLVAGRPDDANRLAERAVDLASAHKERGHEAWALRMRGDIASRRSPPDVERAEASYRQAAALADELGMRPLAAHCHLGLGTLYRRAGSRSRAEEHFAAATTLFRALDMQFWTEKAIAELKAL